MKAPPGHRRCVSTNASTLIRADRLRDHPSAYRAVVALGLFSVAEHAVWVTILVVAYSRGGVVEAGVVSGALLFPAALAAPFIARELSGRRVTNPLALGYGLQLAAVVMTVLVLALDTQPMVFYMAAMLVSVTTVFSRPAHHAFIGAGDEVLSVSVATSVVSGAAQLLGPLLSAAVLIGGDVVHVFAVGAVLLAGSTALTVGLDTPADHDADKADKADERPEPSGGQWHANCRSVTMSALEGQPAPTGRCVLLLMGLLGLVSVTLGVTETLATHVSFSVVDAGRAGTGVLLAGVGAGLLCGAPLAGRFLARLHEHLVMRIGACLGGVGLIALAMPIGFVWSIVSFAVVGIGLQTVVVAGWALLHRHVRQAETCLVFGFLESQQLIGHGLGAVCAGVAIGQLSLWPVVVVVGVVVPLSMWSINAARVDRSGFVVVGQTVG